MTARTLESAARELQLPADFHVSWAGLCPSWLNADVCLGSDDGRVCFSPGQGHLDANCNRFLAEGEAVNGVAFLDSGRMAISSRGEIALMTFRRGDVPLKADFPAGSHGVIAAASGYFVAPLGRSGIMMCKPGTEGEQPVTVHRFDPALNLYKTISLGGNGAETLVTAARKDGIISIEALGDPHAKIPFHHSWASSQESDIVDVCSLEPHGRSVCALSISGEALLIQDVLSETEQPIPRRFPGLEGVAYRVLSSLGHIVILTSRSLYVLENLARRFLEGRPLRREPTRLIEFPVEAVDINSYGDGQILLVLPDAVAIVDVAHLLSGAAGSKSSNGAVDRVADFEVVPVALHPFAQKSMPQNQEPVQMRTSV